MSLLCVSVRDDETTLGCFVGDVVVRRWTVRTEARRTADDWRLVIGGLLGSTTAPLPGTEPDGAELGEIDGVCLSSTVPTVLDAFRTMLSTRFPRVVPVIVGPGVRSGLPVLVDNPREVGTDRVANAVAAAARIGGPCVVVDFGTAITFEALSPTGQYVGGAIAPGLDVSLAALRASGAQLRSVSLEPPRSVLGKNTVEALRSGAVHGFAGLVDALVAKLAAEVGGGAQVRVVATGRLPTAVLDQCRSVTDVDPDLTLHGLRIIHERAR